MDLKFLVVDDSLTMRRIITNMLKGIGYSKFVEAADGMEAMTVLGTDENINFVISDWNMPNVSGLQLVKAIRSNAKTKELPILMVTTRGRKEDIIEALQARVSDYIVKPYTPEIFKQKVEKILLNN